MAAVKTPTKQVIVPTGQKLCWPEAWQLVRDKGGLPSNVLHDDLLVGSNDWKEVEQCYGQYNWAWARELLVYPERHGRFHRGRDFVDGGHDTWGILPEWKIPWSSLSSLPDYVFDGVRIGLFVDPQNVEVRNNWVIIEFDQASVVILNNFLQNSRVGLVDESTRVPLDAPFSVLKELPRDSRRYLKRIDATGIRPIVRTFYGHSAREGRRLDMHARKFGAQASYVDPQLVLDI